MFPAADQFMDCRNTPVASMPTSKLAAGTLTTATASVGTNVVPGRMWLRSTKRLAASGSDA